ncbi:MAG: DNA polymerase I [Elusimicrobiaceae bacterium]|nr:DNA polymerase I [Elusimicrobiaceae bacterium]
MQNSQKLYLVDAHGFLHRNYHALPKLATSKGKEVGALYGFLNWILKFNKEIKPEYIAFCFDSKGPTNRHKIYPAYKANRPPTDEALVQQLKIARDLVSALGFKVCALQGAEADDILATLATSAEKQGAQAIIITSDKDILQIADNNIKIWSGNLKEEPKDSSACKAKFGVDCKYIADYLSIVGDSSDNVPGVSGLGPKAAVELITKFGHLEDILDAAKNKNLEIKETMARKLLAGEQEALLSKKLIVLDKSLPLETALENYKKQKPDLEKLEFFVGEFEFRNLAAFLEELKNTPQKPEPKTLAQQGDLFDMAYFEEPKEQIKTYTLKEVLNKIKNQTEFIIYAQEDLLLLAKDETFYSICEIETISPEEKATLQALVLDDNILKIGHDLKYTFRLLELEAQNKFLNCFDTSLAKYCLDPSGEFSLMGILSVHLNLFINPQAEPKEQLAFYAKHFLNLKAKLEQELKAQNQYKVFKEMETPLMSVLLSMELNGIMVDRAWLKTLEILLSKEMQAAQKEVDALAARPVNINSPKQLGVLLFEELKLPYLRKTKTGYSTDEEVLTSLVKVHPIAKQILAYRESAKLKSTYVEALLDLSSEDTHRVYTNFNQTGTLTGRLSSFSPNLQNIPIRTEKGRLIRQAFIAEEGKTLLSLDYSQIDLRVLAHESGDETLINAFKHTQDIHLQTASEIFNKKPDLITKEERSAAKAINFGIVYGQGPMALAESLGISVAKAKEYIDNYFARYDTLKEWINKTAAKARQEGYVKTFMGHIRYLPEFEASSTRLTSFANRAAVNTIVQGGSSDIIKQAMLDIYKTLPKEVKILLQIHDELVFEVPNEKLKEIAAFVKDKMEQAVILKVPLVAKAKAGKNLNEMGAVL